MRLPFRADRDPGSGYLFSIRSDAPFDFRQFADRRGAWSLGRYAGDGDPFDDVDRFARAAARGTYEVAYSSYRVGGADTYDADPVARTRPPAVHDGYGRDGGYGYGYGGYGEPYAYGSPGDVYGWWGGPAWDGYATEPGWHRRGWRDDIRRDAEYWRAEQTDPRSRYLRHCADGTLAPYTVACGAGAQHPPR